MTNGKYTSINFYHNLNDDGLQVPDKLITVNSSTEYKLMDAPNIDWDHASLSYGAKVSYWGGYPKPKKDSWTEGYVDESEEVVDILNYLLSRTIYHDYFIEHFDERNLFTPNLKICGLEYRDNGGNIVNLSTTTLTLEGNETIENSIKVILYPYLFSTTWQGTRTNEKYTINEDYASVVVSSLGSNESNYYNTDKLTIKTVNSPYLSQPTTGNWDIYLITTRSNGNVTAWATSNKLDIIIFDSETLPDDISSELIDNNPEGDVIKNTNRILIISSTRINDNYEDNNYDVKKIVDNIYNKIKDDQDYIWTYDDQNKNCDTPYTELIPVHVSIDKTEEYSSQEIAFNVQAFKGNNIITDFKLEKSVYKQKTSYTKSNNTSIYVNEYDTNISIPSNNKNIDKYKQELIIEAEFDEKYDYNFVANNTKGIKCNIKPHFFICLNEIKSLSGTTITLDNDINDRIYKLNNTDFGMHGYESDYDNEEIEEVVLVGNISDEINYGDIFGKIVYSKTAGNCGKYYYIPPSKKDLAKKLNDVNNIKYIEISIYVVMYYAYGDTVSNRVLNPVVKRLKVKLQPLAQNKVIFCDGKQTYVNFGPTGNMYNIQINEGKYIDKDKVYYKTQNSLIDYAVYETKLKSYKPDKTFMLDYFYDELKDFTHNVGRTKYTNKVYVELVGFCLPNWNYRNNDETKDMYELANDDTINTLNYFSHDVVADKYLNTKDTDLYYKEPPLTSKHIKIWLDKLYYYNDNNDLTEYTGSDLYTYDGTTYQKYNVSYDIDDHIMPDNDLYGYINSKYYKIILTKEGDIPIIFNDKCKDMYLHLNNGSTTINNVNYLDLVNVIDENSNTIDTLPLVSTDCKWNTTFYNKIHIVSGDIANNDYTDSKKYSLSISSSLNNNIIYFQNSTAMYPYENGIYKYDEVINPENYETISQYVDADNDYFYLVFRIYCPANTVITNDNPLLYDECEGFYIIKVKRDNTVQIEYGFNTPTTRADGKKYITYVYNDDNDKNTTKSIDICCEVEKTLPFEWLLTPASINSFKYFTGIKKFAISTESNGAFEWSKEIDKDSFKIFNIDDEWEYVGKLPDTIPCIKYTQNNGTETIDKEILASDYIKYYAHVNSDNISTAGCTYNIAKEGYNKETEYKTTTIKEYGTINEDNTFNLGPILYVSKLQKHYVDENNNNEEIYVPNENSDFQIVINLVFGNDIIHERVKPAPANLIIYKKQYDFKLLNNNSVLQKTRDIYHISISKKAKPYEFSIISDTYGYKRSKNIKDNKSNSNEFILLPLLFNAYNCSNNDADYIYDNNYTLKEFTNNNTNNTDYVPILYNIGHKLFDNASNKYNGVNKSTYTIQNNDNNMYCTINWMGKSNVISSYEILCEINRNISNANIIITPNQITDPGNPVKLIFKIVGNEVYNDETISIEIEITD